MLTSTGKMLLSPFKGPLDGFLFNFGLTVAVIFLLFAAFRYLFPRVYKSVIWTCKQSVGLVKTVIFILIILFLFSLLLTFAINRASKSNGEHPSGTNDVNVATNNQVGAGMPATIKISGVSRETHVVEVGWGQNRITIRGSDPYYLEKLEQAFNSLAAEHDKDVKDIQIHTGRFVPTAARMQILQQLELVGFDITQEEGL